MRLPPRCLWWSFIAITALVVLSVIDDVLSQHYYNQWQQEPQYPHAFDPNAVVGGGLRTPDNFDPHAAPSQYANMLDSISGAAAAAGARGRSNDDDAFPTTRGTRPAPAPAPRPQQHNDVAMHPRPQQCPVPPSLLAASKVPECAPGPAVLARWGVGNASYNATECCEEHSVMRDMTRAVAAFFDANGWDWFLDGGSLIGNLRHSGTMVPWDHDTDIVLMVANSPNTSGTTLTTGNVFRRLLEFNTWQTRYRMKPCHWNHAHASCDTAFKVHPVGAKMNGVWVQGTKLDVQPMIRIEETVEDNPQFGCIDPNGGAPCFRYWNLYWTAVGIEIPARLVEPTTPCPVIAGKNAVADPGYYPARCPGDPWGYVRHMYGDVTASDTSEDFWGIDSQALGGKRHSMHMEAVKRNRTHLMKRVQREMIDCVNDLTREPAAERASLFTHAWTSLRPLDRNVALRAVASVEGRDVDDDSIAEYAQGRAHGFSPGVPVTPRRCIAQVMKLDMRHFWMIMKSALSDADKYMIFSAPQTLRAEEEAARGASAGGMTRPGTSIDTVGDTRIRASTHGTKKRASVAGIASTRGRGPTLPHLGGLELGRTSSVGNGVGELHTDSSVT